MRVEFEMFRMYRSSVLSYFLRNEMYKRVIFNKEKEFSQQNIIMIGGGRPGRQLAEILTSGHQNKINIVGFIDDKIPTGTEVIPDKKVLGKIDELHQIIQNKPLDEVIIADDNIEYEKLVKVMDQFKELKLKVKLSSERLNGSGFTKTIDGIALLDVTPSGKGKIEMNMKRIIDVFGSLAGLIILSPFLLLMVILIKLGSPGPVLFKQTRVGMNGKTFTFYKFRSMYELDGEDEERKEMMIDFMKKRRSQVEDTKIINDKRVTWIGKFIRRTSLDELPQLINVLKGEMSLVGPRPCLPYEYENYTAWQRKRIEVLPGCTGVWQVSGRSSVSFDDSVLMDLYYINNMSLLFDLKLLFKTIPVILFSKGGK